MCKTWGSKCYSYKNPKTIPNGPCGDKCLDTGQVGVFLGHSNDTTKHFKVYSPELDYSSQSNRVIIDENQKAGDLNLRLKNCIAELQETKNGVPHSKPQGRPKMAMLINPISSLKIIPTIPAGAGS
jgi:hypothetical protein